MNMNMTVEKSFKKVYFIFCMEMYGINYRNIILILFHVLEVPYKLREKSRKALRRACRSDIITLLQARSLVDHFSPFWARSRSDRVTVAVGVTVTAGEPIWSADDSVWHGVDHT